MESKFIIFSPGRTGSSILSIALQQMTDSIVYEAFNFSDLNLDKRLIDWLNTANTKYILPQVGPHHDWEYSCSVSTEEYMDLVYEIHKGTKVLYYQLDRMQFDIYNYIKNHNIKPILLLRRNILNQYVSAKVAQRNKIWVKANKDLEIDQSPITIDLNDYANFVQYQKRYEKKIISQFPNIQTFFYEDLIENWEIILGQLARLIGVQYDTLPEKAHYKIITQPQHEMITNYDTIIDVVKPAFYDRFKADWFSRRIPLFEKFLAPFKDKQVNFLEIGSHEGMSAVWMLKNILTDSNARLTCIDTFNRDYVCNFYANIAPFATKVEVIKNKSVIGLQEVAGPYDFIYVDGYHDAKNTIEDMVLSFNKLKHGGIMAVDDYEWNLGATELNNPKIAVDAFLSIYSNRIEILHKHYQVWIRKK